MTTAAYDALAPHYVEHARTKAPYLGAVDQCLVEWMSSGVTSMLDVGSGDGSRAVGLAEMLGATRLVLSDPAPRMLEQCRRHSASDVWACGAEDLPEGPDTFDVITCLWNVLAEVDGTPNRVRALSRMRTLLSPRGRIVLDVHNRYNIATAGALPVARRLLRDVVRRSEANGTIDFSWDVAGQRIPSRGYLFTPREMSALVQSAELRAIRHAFIDYETGATRGRWNGQIVLCLERG